MLTHVGDEPAASLTQLACWWLSRSCGIEMPKSGSCKWPGPHRAGAAASLLRRPQRDRSDRQGAKRSAGHDKTRALAREISTTNPQFIRGGHGHPAHRGRPSPRANPERARRSLLPVPLLEWPPLRSAPVHPMSFVSPGRALPRFANDRVFFPPAWPSSPAARIPRADGSDFNWQPNPQRTGPTNPSTTTANSQIRRSCDRSPVGHNVSWDPAFAQHAPCMPTSLNPPGDRI